MSRVKKENKNYIKIILPVICVVVVIVTFVLLFDMKNKTENNINTNNITSENLVQNNSQNEIIPENIIDEENTVPEVTNTAIENTIENMVVENEVISNDNDKFSSNKQEKAIELVKKHWGTDNSVYFTNENVRSNVEYIVAVRDKATTEVKHYFKVNIETGTVQIDY